jgi:hypothetical protein
MDGVIAIGLPHGPDGKRFELPVPFDASASPKHLIDPRACEWKDGQMKFRFAPSVIGSPLQPQNGRGQPQFAST